MQKNSIKRINYLDVSMEELKKLPKGQKPTLLLHACCGPCSCYPLTFLCPHFDVTIYFNNSNIYPSDEYERRLNELKKLLPLLKKDYGWNVNLVVAPYENDKYMEDLRPYKDDPECGRRCQLCYKKRMSEAYDFAEANHFDYFTTVMTISRQKSSQVMNEIGKELELSHKFTKYFYSDFKKGGGQEKGREMRIHYNLYNQLYCGCEYSYEKRLEFDRIKNEQNLNK